MGGIATVVLALALFAGNARACGHCVEDSVAAVYDYAVESHAARDGLRIAYLRIDGRRAESVAAAAAAAAALREIAAVAAETIRTSPSPPAVAFAWTGGDEALAAILRAANGRLADAGLGLRLLRVWDARRGLH